MCLPQRQGIRDRALLRILAWIGVGGAPNRAMGLPPHADMIHLLKHHHEFERLWKDFR